MEGNKKYRITNIFRKVENKRYSIDNLYSCTLGVSQNEGQPAMEYIPSNPNGDVLLVKKINLGDCYLGRETERVQDIFNGNTYSEENNGYSNKKYGEIIACNVRPISELLTEEEVKRGYVTLERICELYTYVTSAEYPAINVKMMHL